MGFDPVTYVLSGNAAETRNIQTKLNALSGALYSQLFPRYANAFGNGVIYIRDAAAGQIDCIRVDSELAGQTLYVQISNASGITEAQAEADDKGYATVDLSTVSGENFLYVTAQAYAFPPTGDGGHGELNGVYVNARTNENGLAVYDAIRLTNGVHALARYRLDYDKYMAFANEKPIEAIIAGTGKGVRYEPIEDPRFPPMDSFYYMKMDGYPYGTQAKPAYALTDYPNPNCQVYYARRFYDLTE